VQIRSEWVVLYLVKTTNNVRLNRQTSSATTLGHSTMYSLTTLEASLTGPETRNCVLRTRVCLYQPILWLSTAQDRFTFHNPTLRRSSPALWMEPWKNLAFHTNKTLLVVISWAGSMRLLLLRTLRRSAALPKLRFCARPYVAAERI
jgi:hypothetical protein